jgi:ATP-dependent DNA helicase DinG
LTDVTDIFGPHGPISRKLSKFERRGSQIEMAAAVEKTVMGDGVLFAEAGTGTGKTLAYLVPAILSSKRVVISTGTRNLQEQIFFKDLAFLEEALGISAQASYLKGQENYLCVRRFQNFLRSPGVLAHDSNEVNRLEQWSRTTLNGDRMEVEGLSDDSPLWREVCSTRETRIGQKCPFHSDCHLTKARETARRARIIVVNHHLYFADLATRLQGGSVLPDHDVVIFDEAHLIEDIATEFFSIKISSGRIDRLMTDTMNSVKGARLAEDPNETRRPRLVKFARAETSAMFTAFRNEQQGRHHLATREIPLDIIQIYHKLDSALETVEMSLHPLKGRDQAVDHCAVRISEVRRDLADVIEGDSRSYVHWMETRQRSVVLGASPIDISDFFRRGVLFTIPSVVLTSATLSTSGNFEFLRSRLGIDFDADELSLRAPFDYEKQAVLYVPSGFPDPRDPNFVSHVSDEVTRLVAITGGGALVLCTSVKNMRAIHARLIGRVPGPLLIQGDAPKSVLTSRFVQERSSVLVATTSFWQGVDLPGDALRLVIIDKLPFASPGDPVVAARIDLLKEAGKKPFIDYQVPQAALALKQGFGRLIRTRDDHGVVAIMDQRLCTMPYGATLLKSLPDCRRADLIDDVEKWWAGLDSPIIAR